MASRTLFLGRFGDGVVLSSLLATMVTKIKEAPPSPQWLAREKGTSRAEPFNKQTAVLVICFIIFIAGFAAFKKLCLLTFRIIMVIF